MLSLTLVKNKSAEKGLDCLRTFSSFMQMFFFIPYDNKSLDGSFYYRQGKSLYNVPSRSTAFSLEMSDLKFEAVGARQLNCRNYSRDRCTAWYSLKGFGKYVKVPVLISKLHRSVHHLYRLSVKACVRKSVPILVHVGQPWTDHYTLTRLTEMNNYTNLHLWANKSGQLT